MKPQTVSVPITVKPQSASFWNDVENLMHEIRRQAYRLFELRGCREALELEDWLQAESQLLQPVSLEITSKDRMLHIRADLTGVDPHDLEVNLESGILTIKGACRTDSTLAVTRNIRYIFRQIPLPVNVIPERASASLNNGVLELSVPEQSAKVLGQAA